MTGEKQHCVKGDDCGILGNHTHPDALGVQRGIAVGKPNVTTPTPVPSEVAETTAGEREVEEWEYALEGDWLVEVVNKHTCGTGPDGYYGAHEPGCGSIPVANIGPLLDRVRREEGERIAQAIERQRITCPHHSMPDCSPMLNGCSAVIRLRARIAVDASIARAASVGRGEGQ